MTFLKVISPITRIFMGRLRYIVYSIVYDTVHTVI